MFSSGMNPFGDQIKGTEDSQLSGSDVEQKNHKNKTKHPEGLVAGSRPPD